MYRLRSCQAILDKDQDWQETLQDWHLAHTTEHPTGGFRPVRQQPEGGFGRAQRHAQD